MEKLDSIKRPESLMKLAYKKLRDAILANQLISGEIYTEKELADQLKVSRTPVREALRELSAEGLIESIPGRGIEIKFFTERDLMEIYEIRKALEVATVEKIASNPKGNDLTILKKFLKEERRALAEARYREFINIGRSFHFELCMIGGNRRMAGILDGAWNMIQIAGELAVSASTRGKAITEEHQQIFDHLCKGEIAEVKQAMIHHLDQSLAGALNSIIQRKYQKANGLVSGTLGL